MVAQIILIAIIQSGLIKMEQIRFIKDCGKYGKVGEIKNAPKKSAESFISQGYAEYVNSETNISEKIKEISKQNNNSEEKLVELAKETGFSYNKLNGILNEEIKKSSVEKDDVTNVTYDTNVTNVTDITNPCVTFVMCDISISQALFKENLFEQLLKFFYENIKYFTYDELAKSLNKSEDSIRQLISRKREYFDVKKPDGKICHTYMSQMAVDEINQRITLKQQEIEQKKAEEEKVIRFKKEQKELKEHFYESILGFIQTKKLKREGEIFTLDFNDLLQYSEALSELFLENPESFLYELSEYFEGKYRIETINLPKEFNVNIQDLRQEHLTKLLCIEGRVASLGEVKPLITNIKYDCPSCGSIITVEQNYRNGLLKEPSRCSCGRRGGFKVIKKELTNSCFLQLEDLQNKTDNPHSQRIKAVLFDGMCISEKIKIFTPGNELRCTGILKEVPIKKGKLETPHLNWIFEINSAELVEKDIEIKNISEEEIEEITLLSNKIDEEGLSAITSSFCPEVFGYDTIKEALILQLCNKRNDKKSNSIRNKSNILLIGDPGVAKSVLCNFAVDIMPGARKAVGGGSSAVGITASVIKEEESMGGYRVEPGAMVLAKDLLFLDELNNLQDEDKPKLQEGMNEMTISIDKANIHVKMPVTGGIISCANPEKGNFIMDGSLTVQEQFNIPTPILNRFDTIFVINDIVDEEKDRAIAKSMLLRHRGLLKPKYNREFLRLFFSYIKQVEEPQITEEISKKMGDVYSDARKTKNFGVKINPRFLESMTRMVIASAKIRQSKLVEEKDIERALSILSDSQYNIVNKL